MNNPNLTKDERYKLMLIKIGLEEQMNKLNNFISTLDLENDTRAYQLGLIPYHLSRNHLCSINNLLLINVVNPLDLYLKNEEI